MSDVSQGPGWWQASDGKWYAPEQHPDFQASAAGGGDPTAASEPINPEATQSMPTAPPPGPPPGPAFSAPPGSPPGGVGGPGGPGYPPPVAASGGGAGGAGKWIAVAVVILLIGGGVAFALTRDSGGGSKASFCDKAKALSQDTSLDKAFEDPATVDKAVSAFDDLRKAAPSEIKDDMGTISDALHKVAEAVKKAGNDPEKQASAAFGILFTLDQEKLTKAGENIDEYTKKECGFTLDSGSSDFTDPLTDFSSDSTNPFSDFSDFSTNFSDLSSFLSDFTDAFSDFSDFSFSS